MSVFIFAVCLLPAADNPNPADIRLGKEVTYRHKCGLKITAEGGFAMGVVGAAPIPTNWPEQQVKVVAEHKTPNVKRISFRQFEGVRQMVAEIPNLRAGDSAEATLTLEVTHHELLPPETTTGLVSPKRTVRELAPYLKPSPKIESEHPEIKAQAAKLLDSRLDGWQQVAAIHEWIRQHLTPREGTTNNGALAALRDKTGDCEEFTALFVALCRANGIPARSVWVTRHAYPEFCLADKTGKLHWYPCESLRSIGIGQVLRHRSIIQKGDSFKVPEFPEPQHYARATVMAKNVGRGAKLTLTEIDLPEAVAKE